jgi:predicted porin
MKKTITAALSFCCYCGGLLAATSDFIENYDEDIVLNEWIAEQLREAGYDANLSFCGDANFTTTYINQSLSSKKDSTAASYQGNIDLRFLKKCDSFGCGFEIGTKQKSSMVKPGSAVVNTSYVFLDTGKFGEFRAGFTNTAADLFTIGGDKLLVAYEGPGSSNFGFFYEQSAGTILLTGCTVDDNKAEKIVWYSPTLKGFSLGASFTFNGSRINPFKTLHGSAYSKNVITIAGKYEYGSANDFNATASIGGWLGQGESGIQGVKVRNICAYQIGAIIGYKNFKIAVGFVDNGGSLLPSSCAAGEALPFDANQDYDVHDPRIGVKPGADAGKLYTYGMSYKFNKLTVCAGYYRSVVKFSQEKKERAVADIITLGAEYQFTKALSTYAEYDNIITSTCDRARTFKKACKLSSAGPNRANMLLIGVKFRF